MSATLMWSPIRSLLSSYLYTGITALVVVVAVWFFFFHSNGAQYQTLVVAPQNFAQQVSISGTVVAAHDVDLGFAESGRISGVYVIVGQQVAAGTLIAQIENGDLRASLAQKQAALASQEATLASLQAGTRPEQIAVTEAQVASDQAALSQAQAAVLDAIQNAYTQSDDAVHNKVDQFLSNPRSSSPTLLFSASDSQLQTTFLNARVQAEALLSLWQKHVAFLSAGGDLAGAQQEAQANLSAIANLLSEANGALNSAVPSTSVTQSTLQTYITAVATARSNINTAQTTLTTDSAALSAAEATLSKDQKSLALEKAGSTPDDIAAQEAEVEAARADVENAQAQLTKTLVVAPFAGTITKMDAKVGEIVSPSTSDISMISNGLFQIQIYVPEVEISGLSVGDLATTTLDALGPSVELGAKVIAIDPAETMQNGVATYKTTLQFDKADPRIKSGMTASVLITLSNSPDALVVPQGALFQKNGQQTLQLLKNGTPVDVPVSASSISTLGNIEITSGLSSGDTVILNPDTSK